jgi:hypothetical protein
MAELNRRGMKGYESRQPKPTLTYLTGGLLGQDDTAPYIDSKINLVNEVVRKELTDKLRRTGGGGYRSR